MKYYLSALLLLCLYSAKGQMKGDTAKPSETYMKGNINGTLPIWQEIDAWLVYSYFEDKDHNIWAMGRDRPNTGYSNPGVELRFKSLDSVPTFNDIIFLMQQNKELSDRLDRLGARVDTLCRENTMLWEINRYNARYSTEFDELIRRQIDTLRHEIEDDNKIDIVSNRFIFERIDSLEKRPYLFIDTKGVRPGVWLTNAAGEYQIFITPLNHKR